VNVEDVGGCRIVGPEFVDVVVVIVEEESPSDVVCSNEVDVRVALTLITLSSSGVW
jgi:hypothetical protein